MKEVTLALVVILVTQGKMVFLERPVFLESQDLLVNAEDLAQWVLRVKQVHVDFPVMMVRLAPLVKMVEPEVLDSQANLDPRVYKVQGVSMDVTVSPVLQVLRVELSTKMLMDPCKIPYKVEPHLRFVKPIIFRQTR